MSTPPDPNSRRSLRRARALWGRPPLSTGDIERLEERAFQRALERQQRDDALRDEGRRRGRREGRYETYAVLVLVSAAWVGTSRAAGADVLIFILAMIVVSLASTWFTER